MDPDARVLLAAGFWDGATVLSVRRNWENGWPGCRASSVWRGRAGPLLSGSLGGATVAVELPGQPKLRFRYNQVNPSYFETTGARVLNGRPFARG